MPQLESSLLQDAQLRILEFGAPKTKKTLFAGKIAEAGFNVILFDCDKGSNILRILSPAARKRIFILNGNDEHNRAVAATFLTTFFKLDKFFWDEKAKCRVLTANENTLFVDKSRLLLPTTFFVLDSWTALVQSLILQYCMEHSIDLSDAKKTEWDGYGWCGRLAFWFLEELKMLSCNSVVVAHEDTYEKRAKDQKTILFTKLQIKSTSGPHAMQIPKYFTDILYFQQVGAEFRINAQAETDRTGGVRSVEPNIYLFPDGINKGRELTIQKFYANLGWPLPPSNLPYLDFSAPKVAEKPKAASIIKAGNTATVVNTVAKEVAKPAVKSVLSGLLNKSGK